MRSSSATATAFGGDIRMKVYIAVKVNVDVAKVIMALTKLAVTVAAIIINT